MSIYLLLAQLVVYPLVTLILGWLGYRFARRRGLARSLAWLAAVGVVVVLLAPAWWTSVFNPLPKDEEIIANFRAHRSEFETLIKQYREYQREEDEDHGTHWNASPEIKKLMRDAGVIALTNENTGSLWLSDPYSNDALRRAKELREEAFKDKDPFAPGIRYSSVAFKLAPWESYQWVFVWRYGLIWKQLLHFPEEPRIERGMLIYPPSATGRRLESDRVFRSLNHYPWHWQRGECVLRRVEDKWFIRMCIGVT